MELPSSPPPLSSSVRDNSIPRETEDLPVNGLSSRREGKGNKKRRREDASYSDSSDPAVFSSDDPNASVDDYATRRSKRPLVGTWWMTGSTPRKSFKATRKREFKRNFDSGVFMGSDTTDESNDSSLPELAAEPEVQTSIRSKASREDLEWLSSSLDLAIDIDSTPDFEATEIEKLRRAQRMAYEVIDSCVDTGNSSVDLNGLGLDDIPPAILKSLPLITVQNRRTTQPDPEEYQDLTPKLSLYLAGNKLTKLPGEVCTVTNLTVLSLRNNILTSLPPQISHLTNLHSLNIAINKISYLPFSLRHSLSKSLVSLQLYGNPLLEPTLPSLGADTPKLSIEELRQATKGMSELTPILVAVSTICFFAVDGSPLYQSNRAPSRQLSNPSPQTQRLPANFSSTAGQSSPGAIACVSPPSLLEIVLRASPATHLLSQISTLGPSDVPDSIFRHLLRAVEVRSAGGLKCDECSREYIVPRAEWIEWMTPVLGIENPVPFLKRVCGWACARPGMPVPIGKDGKRWTGCGWKIPCDAACVDDIECNK